MPRTLLAALALLLLFPAVAPARPGRLDRDFGRRGTITLKATNADAVGGAVKTVAGGRVLAGGAAAGKFVIVKLRRSGSLDRRFGTRGQVVPALPGTTVDGVRALAVFRDGRIVAAGTLRQADGTTRMVALRLLPSGEIDPSYGGGLGYALTGPPGAELGAMVMDHDGNVYLGGGRPNGAGGEVPVVVKLLGDGSVDQAFGSGGVDGASLGLTGKATGLLVRSNGTVTFSAGAGPGRPGPATFVVARLLPAGTPDPAFSGDGVVTIPLGPGVARGAGAAAVRGGPRGTTLVAGTDLTSHGTARGAVIRLWPSGALDRRFGSGGVARVSRAGRDIHFTAMDGDRRGRILLAGTARTPDGILVRLRRSGARDRKFANGGLTYPLLGRPPGGTPIFTSLNAVDVSGLKPVVVGSAAGPGALDRTAGGTLYRGSFALTVSRYD